MALPNFRVLSHHVARPASFLPGCGLGVSHPLLINPERIVQPATDLLGFRGRPRIWSPLFR